jgi:hypothetical protein
LVVVILPWRAVKLHSVWLSPSALNPVILLVVANRDGRVYKVPYLMH